MFISDVSHRFFLQAIDPDHGCPVLEATFYVADLNDLRALLGSCADDDPGLRHRYNVDAHELASIHDRFGVSFDPRGHEVCLNSWERLRSIPYLVHTNYELFLLLDGTKLFARMGNHYPPYRHDEEERFDRYVAEGVLHKEVCLTPFPTSHRLKDGRMIEGDRAVYYVPKGEEWRIQAWKLVRAAFQKSKWNDDFERLEGMLFGYTDWQMDWWIKHIRQQRAELSLNVDRAKSSGADP